MLLLCRIDWLKSGSLRCVAHTAIATTSCVALNCVGTVLLGRACCGRAWCIGEGMQEGHALMDLSAVHPPHVSGFHSSSTPHARSALGVELR